MDRRNGPSVFNQDLCDCFASRFQPVHIQPWYIKNCSFLVLTCGPERGHNAGSKEKHANEHSKSAFIDAYVVSGAIESQVNDGMKRIYHAGESFFDERSPFIV